MRAEAARHQRAHLRERVPDEPATLAVHALGERRDVAAELQHIAEPLLAPHEQRLAGKRLAAPAGAGQHRQASAQFAGTVPARLVAAPAVRVVAAHELDDREVETERRVVGRQLARARRVALGVVPALRLLHRHRDVVQRKRVVGSDLREPRGARERPVEILHREPRDDEVDPRLHIARIGLHGRGEQRDFLAAIAARQAQRDREVVAQRRPAGVERERRAVRRDGVGVTVEHLQRVAMIEAGARARVKARRAFGQRERVGLALPRDQRRGQSRERGHVGRVQMTGGAQPQIVRGALAARMRVGGPAEQREQRRQQWNEEVVRVVHALRESAIGRATTVARTAICAS